MATKVKFKPKPKLHLGTKADKKPTKPVNHGVTGGKLGPGTVTTPGKAATPGKRLDPFLNPEQMYDKTLRDQERKGAVLSAAERSSTLTAGLPQTLNDLNKKRWRSKEAQQGAAASRGTGVSSFNSMALADVATAHVIDSDNAKKLVSKAKQDLYDTMAKATTEGNAAKAMENYQGATNAKEAGGWAAPPTAAVAEIRDYDPGTPGVQNQQQAVQNTLVAGGPITGAMGAGGKKPKPKGSPKKPSAYKPSVPGGTKKQPNKPGGPRTFKFKPKNTTKGKETLR